MDEPRIVDDFHLSNALPDSALQLIQSTPGTVLHLSAGGSAKQFDHVVEAEAAVFRHCSDTLMWLLTCIICHSQMRPLKQ